MNSKTGPVQVKTFKDGEMLTQEIPEEAIKEVMEEFDLDREITIEFLIACAECMLRNPGNHGAALTEFIDVMMGAVASEKPWAVKYVNSFCANILPAVGDIAAKAKGAGKNVVAMVSEQMGVPEDGAQVFLACAELSDRGVPSSVIAEIIMSKAAGRDIEELCKQYNLND